MADDRGSIAAQGLKLSKTLEKNSSVRVEIVRSAGHHVYIDKVQDFNKIVCDVLDTVDTDADKIKVSSAEFH